MIRFNIALSSSELEESELTADGGEQGFHRLGLILEMLFFRFCRERWAGILQMPCLVTLAATKSSILVIQVLSPDKVVDIEIDLIWQSLAQIKFHTYSGICVKPLIFPPVVPH